MSNRILRNNRGSTGKHWKVKDTSKMSAAKKGNTNGFQKGYHPKNEFQRGHHSRTEFKKGHKYGFQKGHGFINGNLGCSGKHWKLQNTTKQKMSEWRINHPNKKFSNTQIEQKIAAELTKRKIYFQQNIGLCKTANVDFYLPEYHIVIQCDGCYYHNCPTHFPTNHIGRREYDTKQDSVLTFNGFNVYRFWEHEIDESPAKCLNRIFKDTKKLF